MAHEDKGKYFKKHPEGTTVSDNLKEAIQKSAKNNNISCKAAEKIAQTAGCSLGDVGVAIDMLNINIAQCQIGLFGLGGTQKVPPAPSVAPELEAAIRKALVNDRLSCSSAWAIAGELGVKRLEVGAACENLKIKVKPCQLGAF
ncbi:MAG: hypothetical protein GX874_03365 [Smithella sp.]|jgi:hypothetical protein|nr:hypothetical protein [Smithellaceae bacterium]NLA40439.1 hypothetical protein [Smithella sp.]